MKRQAVHQTRFAWVNCHKFLFSRFRSKGYVQLQHITYGLNAVIFLHMVMFVNFSTLPTGDVT